MLVLVSALVLVLVSVFVLVFVSVLEPVILLVLVSVSGWVRAQLSVHASSKVMVNPTWPCTVCL